MKKRIIPDGMILLDLLPAKVPLQQAFKSLAVKGFIEWHFMHDVVDDVQIQLHNQPFLAAGAGLGLRAL